MILKLKRIRSSCKYILVHCGLSSSVVCIASVSVRFRSKEWVWNTAWKMAPSFILWLSFRFLRSQNQNPIAQSFFAPETKSKRLLRRLVVLWCIIVIGLKTSLHNRCYFLTFCRQVKTHSAKWARSVRHTQWGKVTMVCQQALFFLCLPHHGRLTLQARLVRALARPKNAKK